MMARLEDAIAPASVVAKLKERGIEISERALKERAREIGAYRQIGRAIFFTPEDLEKIMEPVAATPPKALPGKRGVRASPSAETELNEVRARLQSLKRARS